jgi:hypothetical protein
VLDVCFNGCFALAEVRHVYDVLAVKGCSHVIQELG